MGLRTASLALGTASLFLLVPAARSETLYFKNKRTLEATSYQIKGPLIYVTLAGGKTVYLRADSVDWEGTKQLKDPGMILQKTDYESVDDVIQGEASGPAERLTAADLRKSGSGFKLRRSGASSIVVDVPANQAWIDSRVTVRSGQVANIRVTGSATVAPGMDVGPDGSASSSAATNALVPSLPFGALLVRIGLASEPLVVGSSLRLVASTSGRLFFSVNDRQSSDNNGAFAVRIDLPQGATGTAASFYGSSATTTAAPSNSTSATHTGTAPAKGFVGGIDKARSTRDAAQKSRE